MAMSINTNMGSLRAQQAASNVSNDMQQAMNRLSTGQRINSASDDAAGSAIASRLTSEIRGTNQAIRNALDSQALIDTAEGALAAVAGVVLSPRKKKVIAKCIVGQEQEQTETDLSSVAVGLNSGWAHSCTFWTFFGAQIGPSSV